MTPDQIKQKTILVKYILPEKLPANGYRRMQYYTSFADEPESFYLGLSIRTKYSREKLNEWVRQGQLVELTEPIILPYEKDLYLSKDGKVVVASGYNPKDDDRQIVAAPKEFRKANILLKQLDNSRLKIEAKTRILAE